MFEIQEREILDFVLIFLRVGGIFSLLPLFGDQPVPIRVRILASVLLAWFAHSLVPPQMLLKEMPTDIVLMSSYVVRELMVGLGIGFVARISFEGILLSASIVGYQMGFGMASLLVPDAGQQMNGFTALHRAIIMLIFFSLNFHHIFIEAIFTSFAIIPTAEASYDIGLASFMIKITSGIFSVGMQLAAPVLVALMFTMAAMGLIARTVPQMNVFTMSFPVSFFIGLVVYIATFPFYPQWMRAHFEAEGLNILAVLNGMTP